MKNRRTLAEKISSLSAIQQKEILKIIQQYAVPFSSNKNGHFFDIEDVPPQCLSTIEKFVDYSIANQAELDEYDRQLQMCKYSRSGMNGLDSIDDSNIEHENCCIATQVDTIHQKDVCCSNDSADASNRDVHDASVDDIIASDINDENIRDLCCQENVCPGIGIPVRFVNCRKKFSKPPRNKKYDPDDISLLVRQET